MNFLKRVAASCPANSPSSGPAAFDQRCLHWVAAPWWSDQIRSDQIRSDQIRGHGGVGNGRVPYDLLLALLLPGVKIEAGKPNRLAIVSVSALEFDHPFVLAAIASLLHINHCVRIELVAKEKPPPRRRVFEIRGCESSGHISNGADHCGAREGGSQGCT